MTRLFFLLCVIFLAGTASAASNPEEVIVGEWRETNVFCENGAEYQDISSSLPEEYSISFDGAGNLSIKGENHDLGEIFSGKVCTLIVAMDYSINGNQVTMGNLKNMRTPDCPEVDALFKMAFGNKSISVNSNYFTGEFKVSLDNQKMTIFGKKGDGDCGEKDRSVTEFERVQS